MPKRSSRKSSPPKRGSRRTGRKARPTIGARLHLGWPWMLRAHLSRTQKSELSGVAAIAAGLSILLVLTLSRSGIIGGFLHTVLIGAFGFCAPVIAALLLFLGGRQIWLGEPTGGQNAGTLMGGLMTVVGLLGLAGILLPGADGVVGNFIAHVFTWPSGPAVGAVILAMLAVGGAVIAVELRLRFLMEKAGWMAGRLRSHGRSSPGDDPARIPQGKNGKQEKKRKGELALKEGALATLDIKGLPPEYVPFNDPPLELDEPVPPRREAGAPFGSGTEPFLIESVLPPGGKNGETASASTSTGAMLPGVSAVLLEGAGTEPIEVSWTIPNSELLDTVHGHRERLEQEVRTTGATIASTLQSFGIDARIIGASSGPTVTQYELQPARGVPVRKILGYQTDLSLALAAPIRIQPFIPGKPAIGIEVPNKAAQLVTLKEIVQSRPFNDPAHRLTVALGADVSGQPVVGDLARMPHLLIAGATGSGKSVCINTILAGFLLQATPRELKLVLIDPKRVELSGFADIPHLLVPVVVETEAAVASLRWAVKEMEERYKLFASHNARNITSFNEKAESLGLSPLPMIVIVIDELADLMMVAAGEIEDLICRIAQLARAVGIHLIVATQRPSADIITGLIKANIPSRIAFAVASGVDSRVILDEMGAEKLLGRGDMLYLPVDEGKPRRLQGAYVSERELDSLISFWRSQGKPDYQEEIFQVEATVSWARDAGKRDPLFPKAAHIVAAEGRAAASLLQRKLSVGYTRAARLIDQLAEYNVVGPYEGSKSRDVLMDVVQVDELLSELGDEPGNQSYQRF